jgi:hypothetical protein
MKPSLIFGELVSKYAPGKSTWLMEGHRKKSRKPLRSMSDPKSEGQPDTYGGTNWKTIECGTTQANDYCRGTHKQRCLKPLVLHLTIGKSGTNDIGNSYNVTGINIDASRPIA